MSFRDRTALVTGASSGIGRALALRLGRDGARVGLIDRDEAGLGRLREELDSLGVRSASSVTDIGDRAAVGAAVAGIVGQVGPVDLLFPCAGICGFEVVDDLNVPQVERIMRINFMGVVYSVEAVLPGMLERGTGQIVALASMTAVRAIPFEASYSASKAALVGYLESLRPSLRNRGVLVTLAYPGFVMTPLLQNLIDQGMAKPYGIVDADTAARKILAAARTGWRTVCFPLGLTALVSVGRILPPAVYDWVMTRMAKQVKLPY
ncbi:MAG: SDR family NAD(P)-dependent oxidoreductase [Gemmataceae bacterium]